MTFYSGMEWIEPLSGLVEGLSGSVDYYQAFKDAKRKKAQEDLDMALKLGDRTGAQRAYAGLDFDPVGDGLKGLAGMKPTSRDTAPLSTYFDRSDQDRRMKLADDKIKLLTGAGSLIQEGADPDLVERDLRDALGPRYGEAKVQSPRRIEAARQFGESDPSANGQTIADLMPSADIDRILNEQHQKRLLNKDKPIQSAVSGRGNALVEGYDAPFEVTEKKEIPYYSTEDAARLRSQKHAARSQNQSMLDQQADPQLVDFVNGLLGPMNKPLLPYTATLRTVQETGKAIGLKHKIEKVTKPPKKHTIRVSGTDGKTLGTWEYYPEEQGKAAKFFSSKKPYHAPNNTRPQVMYDDQGQQYVINVDKTTNTPVGEPLFTGRFLPANTKAIRDQDDKGKVVFRVHKVDPKTGKLSKDPIQTINTQIDARKTTNFFLMQKP
jgi:hypothetical protein